MRLITSILVMILTACQFVTSANAAGLVVDKMFIIADEKKNGVLTLTNTSDLPLFITATIDEFQLNEDGTEFIRNRYDASNVDSWKISTTQNKLVLHSGESNNIGIRSLCYNVTCDDSRDLMFFVTMMPSPYREPGSEADAGSTMQLNYGFSPVFIMPTNNPSIDYKIKHTDDHIVVENKSNTLLYVSVNSCETSARSMNGCFNRYIVVAGRTKAFALNDNAKSTPLSISVASHDGSFSKSETLTVNGVIKGK